MQCISTRCIAKPKDMDSRLITAFEAPLLDLEKKIIEATPAIERWFRLEWQDYTPPFYFSADLHNTGFKLAPVDSSLFPNGFNHLPAEMQPLAVQAAMAAIDRYCPDAKNILLIPENNPQDDNYPQNLLHLIRLLQMAGLNLQLGHVGQAGDPPTEIALPDGTVLTAAPLLRIHANRRVGLPNYNPCAILLNNDLSKGPPEILQDLHEQTLLPPLHSGSAIRKQSNHFSAYRDVARRFARAIDIDPWIISSLFRQLHAVDIASKDGKEHLARSVGQVLNRILQKHKKYNIDEKPFVTIRIETMSGEPYLIHASDAHEIADITLAGPDDSPAAGEKARIADVFIQECVRSREKMDEAVAEPTVYMIDRYVIGGFYRVFNRPSDIKTPNAQISHFVPPAFSQPHAMPDKFVKPGTPSPNRFYMYGVIARLALLAAAIEMEKTDPELAEI